MRVRWIFLAVMAVMAVMASPAGLAGQRPRLAADFPSWFEEPPAPAAGQTVGVGAGNSSAEALAKAVVNAVALAESSQSESREGTREIRLGRVSARVGSCSVRWNFREARNAAGVDASTPVEYEERWELDCVSEEAPWTVVVRAAVADRLPSASTETTLGGLVSTLDIAEMLTELGATVEWVLIPQPDATHLFKVSLPLRAVRVEGAAR